MNFGQCLNYQALYYFNHKFHIILHTINITKLHDTDLNYRVRYNSVVACGAITRFLMVDPLNYFPFQQVLHDWCKKVCGMCYPVCGIIHIIKEPLLLIRKSSS